MTRLLVFVVCVLLAATTAQAKGPTNEWQYSVPKKVVVTPAPPKVAKPPPTKKKGKKKPPKKKTSRQYDQAEC